LLCSDFDRRSRAINWYAWCCCEYGYGGMVPIPFMLSMRME
jgi:hypothetical protein